MISKNYKTNLLNFVIKFIQQFKSMCKLNQIKMLVQKQSQINSSLLAILVNKNNMQNLNSVIKSNYKTNNRNLNVAYTENHILQNGLNIFWFFSLIDRLFTAFNVQQIEINDYSYLGADICVFSVEVQLLFYYCTLIYVYIAIFYYAADVICWL